jgi:L-ascorbate 6-phosphate lactonase
MKKLLLYLLFVCLSGVLFSQNERMIDQIKAHKDGIAIWWIGHNSWVIKSDGLVISTDVYIEDKLRISPSPITPEELAEVLDISFVTHAHGDHFNGPNSRVLLEKSKCLFVLPESCLAEAAKFKIPDNRIVIAKPREPFEIKGIKISPIRALHANPNYAIAYYANFQDCGYVFTIAGKTIFQPGDSYLLEDQLFLKKVNVLFFSPTEHNMYIQPSVVLINALDPDYIFPQHHSTVAVTEANRFWAKGYPDEVKILLSQAMKERYHILKPGDKWIIK